MDLRVIGMFIKEMRKEKGLTQIELAEKLFVSEKTISKWECGNGFPDTTLMLPLCKELGVTANELLSGKKLEDGEYKRNAEKNIILLQKKNQKYTKALLLYTIMCGILAFEFMFAFIAWAWFPFIDVPVWARVILIVIGFLVFCISVHFCCIAIKKDAMHSECPKCKKNIVGKRK